MFPLKVVAVTIPDVMLVTAISGDPDNPVALPVTLPVMFPLKVVAVTIPVTLIPLPSIVVAVPTFIVAAVAIPVMFMFLPVTSSYTRSPVTFKSPVMNAFVAVNIPTDIPFVEELPSPKTLSKVFVVSPEASAPTNVLVDA